jgi:hypothetical protein
VSYDQLDATIGVDVSGSNQGEPGRQSGEAGPRFAAASCTLVCDKLVGELAPNQQPASIEELVLAIAVDIHGELVAIDAGTSGFEVQGLGILFERSGAETTRRLEASERESAATGSSHALGDRLAVVIVAGRSTRKRAHGPGLPTGSRSSGHLEEAGALAGPAEHGELPSHAAGDESLAALGLHSPDAGPKCQRSDRRATRCCGRAELTEQELRLRRARGLCRDRTFGRRFFLNRLRSRATANGHEGAE